jgi:GNAT superfamily N-acetyltransferase
MDSLKPQDARGGRVPIRALGEQHRGRIASHLLALDDEDRYLRFGYSATDEQIQRYVDGLDFERDDIFGIFNRKLELIAIAHLAFLPHDPDAPAGAEFGVSVLKKARGRGYGSQLFERAVVHARNEGVELMFIHALSENTAMIKIARKGGATLERAGSETEAYLRLPPATLDSRVTEMLEEQVAQADYRLKRQAKTFLDFLATLQDLRRGGANARSRSGR